MKRLISVCVLFTGKNLNFIRPVGSIPTAQLHTKLENKNEEESEPQPLKLQTEWYYSAEKAAHRLVKFWKFGFMKIST